MDDPENDFDSVQWRRDDERDTTENDSQRTGDTRLKSNGKRRQAPGQGGSLRRAPSDPNADAVDRAGIGKDGFLECSVDRPQKEGEGTKDAYVSYLVTTHVSIL